LPDGSWPAAAEAATGCFVTSLACWALLAEKNAAPAVAAGLRWLNEDRPVEGALWRRWLRRLSPARNVTTQSDRYTGWPWTPGTSSWVEPTAIALLLMERCPRQLLPSGLELRRQSAEAMLYDRMCPGGGWNCGNPMVYGVAGQPLAIPTAWALLALRHHRQRAENLLSLNWFARNLAQLLGPGSLAWARICLQAYGCDWPAVAPCPESVYARDRFLDSVPVAAWACLAASPEQSWLLGDSPQAA
jgi:hypothetical protein